MEPLVDSFGRVHTDLRISVTDRCNIRCAYCMSSEPVRWFPHEAILTFEEIARVVGVGARLGISHLRLTGGEPLVRTDVVRLVEMLCSIPQIAEVAMTTNGTLLARFAAALKAAGLARLNISLDTLRAERFREVTRRDHLAEVLEGIAAARRAGFTLIKLNAVAVRGLSEAEIVPLARFARQQDLELRFIEYMPLHGAAPWSPAQVLRGEEILQMLAAEVGPLTALPAADPHSPARLYCFGDGGGRIGLIPAVTRPFCGHCNRLRLTADGKLRNCLFSPGEGDLRAVLRSGGSDGQLADVLQAAVCAKKIARGSDDGQFNPVDRPMHQIGG